MSAHVQSALRYRFTLPAWLLAVVIAAAIAIGAVALLGGSSGPATAPAASGTGTQAVQPTVCVDGSVGHC
jgi:hypothetical protein